MPCFNKQIGPPQTHAIGWANVTVSGWLGHLKTQDKSFNSFAYNVHLAKIRDYFTKEKDNTFSLLKK